MVAVPEKVAVFGDEASAGEANERARTDATRRLAKMLLLLNTRLFDTFWPIYHQTLRVKLIADSLEECLDTEVHQTENGGSYRSLLYL